MKVPATFNLDAGHRICSGPVWQLDRGSAGMNTATRLSASEIQYYLNRLVGSARHRSKVSHGQCDLDLQFLQDRWKSYSGCCEVSGLPFTSEEFPSAFVKRPFALSLDQIVPGGGYLKTNVRIVCTCANFSMNEWGLDVLVRLADAVVDHSRQNLIRDRLVAIWRARLEGRIAEAQVAIEKMGDAEAKQYRRRVAALRRNLTLEPDPK